MCLDFLALCFVFRTQNVLRQLQQCRRRRALSSNQLLPTTTTTTTSTATAILSGIEWPKRSASRHLHATRAAAAVYSPELQCSGIREQSQQSGLPSTAAIASKWQLKIELDDHNGGHSTFFFVLFFFNFKQCWAASTTVTTVFPATTAADISSVFLVFTKVFFRLGKTTTAAPASAATSIGDHHRGQRFNTIIGGKWNPCSSFRLLPRVGARPVAFLLHHRPADCHRCGAGGHAALSGPRDRRAAREDGAPPAGVLVPALSGGGPRAGRPRLHQGRRQAEGRQ